MFRFSVLIINLDKCEGCKQTTNKQPSENYDLIYINKKLAHRSPGKNCLKQRRE